MYACVHHTYIHHSSYLLTIGTSNRFANYLDMHFLKKGDKAGSFQFLLGDDDDGLVMMMMDW